MSVRCSAGRLWQAVGTRQGLGVPPADSRETEKMVLTSASTRKVEGEISPTSTSIPWEFQQVPSPPADTPSLSYKSPSAAALVLSLGVSESAFEPFMTKVFIPCSPILLLDTRPFGFQRQTFWGDVSPFQVARVGVLNVGLKPLPPQGEAPYLWDLLALSSLWAAALRVGCFARLYSCLLPVSVWLLYPSSANIQFLPRGICSVFGIDLLCPWDKVSPGSSYDTIFLWPTSMTCC